MSSASTPESHGVHAHENTDVNLRPVVVAGLGLILVLIISALAMFGLFDILKVEEARTSPQANPMVAAEGPQVPPAPRLQVHPIKDLQELRKAENDLLTSYGWKDQSAGIVHIPIARAMEMLAARNAQQGAAAR